MDQKAPLTSLKSPLLMNDSWTPKEMWQQAHLSDMSTCGFGSACSDSGYFDSRKSHCCNPPGAMSTDEVEESLPHGYPWIFPLSRPSCSPTVLPMWESGWGSWRPPRSLGRETVSTSVLQMLCTWKCLFRVHCEAARVQGEMTLSLR